MARIKKYRKYIIAILMLSVLILIARFISEIDFHSLTTYLRKTPSMFVLVVITSFIAYVLSATGWMLCMGDEGKKTSIAEVFAVRHVGEMLGVFNPTSIVAGDMFKISLITKNGITKQNGISSILLLRMINFLSAMLLIIISIIYLTFGKLNSSTEAIIFIMIAVAIAFGFLLAKYLLDDHLYFGKTMEKIRSKTKWPFLKQKTIDSCYEINTIASSYFKNNKLKFSLAFLLITFHWIFGALEFFIILQTLHIPISVVDAVAVEMGVSLFKSLGAVVPGQIGIEEYGNKIMLDVIGIASNKIWFVVSLVRRSRQLFWLAIAGIFLPIISKKKSYKTL